MTKYSITNQAVEDLNSIWLYTCENWSENQANKYYDLLLKSISGIANNPTLGKQYKMITNNLYGLKVSRHIIFYRFEEGEAVLIVRILHERMDIETKIS